MLPRLSIVSVIFGLGLAIFQPAASVGFNHVICDSGCSPGLITGFALESGGNLATLAAKDFATSAKQDTGNTNTGSIDIKFTTLNAKDFATSAKQDTGNTNTGSIDTKFTTLNAKDFATSAKQDTGNTSLGTLLTTSDFDSKTGSLTESAPATDTASSGINGRLQRIAQRLTSLIALLPSALVSGRLDVNVGGNTAALPAGTAYIGEITNATTATTTNAASTSYTTTAASTNATSVKGSAGNIYVIRGVNTTSTTYYLRMYNLTTAPTCSSATGFVETIPIPSTTTGAGIVAGNGGIGQAYGTGIGFCITGGGSSTDNTNAATGVYITILYK